MTLFLPILFIKDSYFNVMKYFKNQTGTSFLN